MVAMVQADLMAFDELRQEEEMKLQMALAGVKET
jgi:hypothetical protein